MNEHDLIIRLKAGDRKAFNALYTMYARRLMAWCLQYVAVREDAEELVQDVFIALWKNRECIRNDETLRPLLFTTLRNRMTNAFRSRLNSPVYEDYVNSQAHTAEAPAEAGIEYHEFYKRVMASIASLPQTQRQVVTLSRIHGLKNSEIAAYLGLTDKTVRNTLSAALRALRLRLGLFILLITDLLS